LASRRVGRRTTHTLTCCAPPAGDGSETSSSTSTLEQQQQQQEELPQASQTVATATVTASTNGTSADSSSSDKDAPKHLDWVPDGSSLAPLQFTPLSGSEKAWTNCKLAFALPWRRFKVSAAALSCLNVSQGLRLRSTHLRLRMSLCCCRRTQHAVQHSYTWAAQLAVCRAVSQRP
jgi:hypothetical protein